MAVIVALVEPNDVTAAFIRKNLEEDGFEVLVPEEVFSGIELEEADVYVEGWPTTIEVAGAHVAGAQIDKPFSYPVLRGAIERAARAR